MRRNAIFGVRANEFIQMKAEKDNGRKIVNCYGSFLVSALNTLLKFQIMLFQEFTFMRVLVLFLCLHEADTLGILFFVEATTIRNFIPRRKRL